MSLWRPELKLGPETPVYGKAAQVHSKQPPNSLPRPQPDGRSFIIFRQPVYEGFSCLTVSAVVRLRESYGAHVLIGGDYTVYHYEPHGSAFLCYPGRV